MGPNTCYWWRSFWSAINIAHTRQQDQPKSFFSTGIQKLVERYKKCIVLQGDYVEKWYVRLLTVTSIKAVKYILLLLFDSPSYISEIAFGSATILIDWEMIWSRQFWSIILVCFTDGSMNFDNLNLDNSYGPTKAYCQSKLANVLFSNELARRLEGKTGGLGEWQSVSTH